MGGSVLAAGGAGHIGSRTLIAKANARKAGAWKAGA
jgi:hypothetical protein